MSNNANSSDLKPQPSTIVGKPATVQDCQNDYRQGTQVRTESEKRDAHARR